MCAGITTFTPLYNLVNKDDNLAVIGCGGLGHFAIQWAVKMGARVDVFTTTNSKKKLIKELGG